MAGGPSCKGCPELQAAIRRGQFHDARRLVSAGGDVNCRDAARRTPLILCALLEQEAWAVGIARMLLEADALVGLEDKLGRNALIHACLRARPDLVETFLGALDFDLNHRDRYGNTALFYAASGGRLDVASSLVRRLRHLGETLDRPNRFGMTPLLEACRLGHARLAAMLVENGARAERRDGVRRWDAADWEREHARQRAASERARNRSYEKPWLMAVAKRTAGTEAPVAAAADDGSGGGGGVAVLRRTASLPGISGDLVDPGGGGGSSSLPLSSPSSERTVSGLAAAAAGRPPLNRARTLPTLNAAKLLGLTRSWVGEPGADKDLIRAKFHPSPVPFSDPARTTEAERTHNAYGQWRMTQNLRPADPPPAGSEPGRRGGQQQRRAVQDPPLWKEEFRQIFRRYENQATASFRRRAREPAPPDSHRLDPHSPVAAAPVTAAVRARPAVTADGDRKAPSGRISRRHSTLDAGPPLKRLPGAQAGGPADPGLASSFSSSSSSSQRKAAAASSADSSSAAAGRTSMLNTFRRKRSAIFGSTSSLGRGSEDEADTRPSASGSAAAPDKNHRAQGVQS